MLEVIYGSNVGNIWIQPDIQYDIYQLANMIKKLELEYYEYIEDG